MQTCYARGETASCHNDTQSKDRGVGTLTSTCTLRTWRETSLKTAVKMFLKQCWLEGNQDEAQDFTAGFSVSRRDGASELVSVRHHYSKLFDPRAKRFCLPVAHQSPINQSINHSSIILQLVSLKTLQPACTITVSLTSPQQRDVATSRHVTSSAPLSAPTHPPERCKTSVGIERRRRNKKNATSLRRLTHLYLLK